MTTYNKRFSHSNKRWVSERFSLLSKYELLLLEHFLFCFNVFIFLYDYQFLFLLSSLLLCFFLLLFFCHCHCHYYFLIFNAFNFYFSSCYHSTLSLYISNIFKFQTNDVTKHCSKLAIKTLRLYQCLWWELWTLFALLVLLNIFFWSDTFIFCTWQLFLLFCK